MSERRSLAFPLGLEIRAGGDGRTIAGIAVPFDQPTEIHDATGSFREEFVRGAFDRTIRERAGRVKLLAQHDAKSFPIGRASLLREDARGLYSEFVVSKTARGDEALELVRDGTLDGLSVGFAAVRDTWTRDHVRQVLEAKLYEVSVVPWPAYDGARISAVRSACQFPTLEVARRRLRLLELEAS